MKTSISSEDLNQFGAEKIESPPKPDGQTDICNYRVASLLKKNYTIVNSCLELDIDYMLIYGREFVIIGYLRYYFCHRILYST